MQALRLIRVGGRCIVCVVLCTFGVRLLFLSSFFSVSFKFSSGLVWVETKHQVEHTTILPFRLLSHTSVPSLVCGSPALSSLKKQINPALLTTPVFFLGLHGKNRDKRCSETDDKTFSISQGLLISLISSVVYPSLLSHFKNQRCRARL